MFFSSVPGRVDEDSICELAFDAYEAAACVQRAARAVEGQSQPGATVEPGNAQQLEQSVQQGIAVIERVHACVKTVSEKGRIDLAQVIDKRLKKASSALVEALDQKSVRPITVKEAAKQGHCWRPQG